MNSLKLYPRTPNIKEIGRKDGKLKTKDWALTGQLCCKEVVELQN